ncbi:MAG: alpha/beta hydrolase [Clostridiales bacterium]|nr:alpha/beta hydrolase [Clostridiales bacterium]
MIQKKIVTITPFGLDRTLHLYLPEDYQSSGLTYPVMYFFDGHNLFDDRDATYGKCWGFQEYMKTATCQVILVGIECNHEGNRRLVEFCPYPVRHIHGWEDYDGRGKDLMDWLVYELKPMIDNSYPTKKDRVHTAIGGSSMGGLMALFAVLRYNAWFSKAACLSCTLEICMPSLRHEIQQALLAEDSKIYLSWGSHEDADWNAFSYASRRNVEILQLLIEKKISIYPYLHLHGQHSESSWEQEIPIFMNYLWK